MATGHVEGWGAPVEAKADVVFAHPDVRDRERAQASRENFVRSHARFDGDGVLGRKVAARLEFLRNVDEGRLLYNFR